MSGAQSHSHRELLVVPPNLVVYDEDGKPFTVKYHLLSSMLLNELKKEHTRNDGQARELEDLRAEVRDLRALEARLAALESLAAPEPSAVVAADSR